MMLRVEDPRWLELTGGYRTPYDPRPAIAKLESGTDIEAAWNELWQQLHHQGDVGEASYAAVPHLVRIYCQRGTTDWNTYAMVATIELARGERLDPPTNKRQNPEVPEWLREGYFQAIASLAETGMKELERVQDPYDLRGILCIIALQKGARTYARILMNYSEEEILDMESMASEM
jgi:hypothetical protein